MPSSLIVDLSCQLEDVEPVMLGDAPLETLAVVLAGVPDPRDARGRRYSLVGMLSVLVAAVMAGARSWAAVGRWPAGVDRPLLARLGLSRRGTPVATTFARLAEVLDTAALDAAIGAWLAGILTDDTYAAPVREDGPRSAIAVDGKTLRGAVDSDGRRPHLLAALDHDSGLILAQQAVDGKSNEITAFAPLLDRLDITETVITADALHTQRAHAIYLHERGAYYLLQVKANQPGLFEHLLELDWDAAPVRHLSTRRIRGRREARTCKILLADGGVDFPHATQLCAIERRISTRQGVRVEIAFAITNLPVARTRADQLANLVKDHWKIEAFHYLRDVTFGEDASRIHTGNAPHVMASIRNLAIALLRLTGWTNLTAATQHMATHPHDALQLLGLT